MQRPRVAEQPGTFVLEENATNSLVSVANDLGANILLSTKEKIWSNDYIDLAKLLHTDPSVEKQHQLVFEDGQIKVKPNSKEKKITNISEWTDAFLIFSAVYLKKFPEQTQAMLKFLSSIRLGASRIQHMGWKDYDIQFRLRRATNPLLGWSSIDAELWLVYVSSSPVHPPTSSTDLKKTWPITTKPGPYAKCYDFNLKASCTRKNCHYLHLCLKCGQGHPSVNCWQGQSKQLSKVPSMLPAHSSTPSHSFHPRLYRPNRQ